MSADSDYERSNSIERVDKKRFSTKYMQAVLKTDEDAGKRRKAAQALVDHLSKLYKINSPKVVITERPRRSFQRGSVSGQTYGFYRHSGNPAGDTIVIYNTTAKTGKPVSIKSFADTLLHEFTHHYDTRYLKIDSRHTAGFYKRISSLKDNLTSAKLNTKEIKSDITDLSVRQLIIGVKGNVGG